MGDTLTQRKPAAMVKLNAVKRVRRAARWVRNLSAPYGLILLYHRIAEPASDPQAMCVSPARFAEHLEALREIGRPVPLQQLVRGFRGRENGKPALAVTFDDGYADNLSQAKPLLERYEVPATVFVTSGDIGRESAFWWEELERLFLKPGTLPESLSLHIDGQRRRWELGAAAHYSEAAFEQHRGWNLFLPAKRDPGPRHRCYRALNSLLHALTDIERQKLMDELLSWAGAESSYSPVHRMLSPSELGCLAASDLIEIGSHTVTHARLSSLTPTAQMDEITESKLSLEQITGRRVESFAYPYGSRSSYTGATIDCVRAAGYGCACVSAFDAVWRDADAFQLPRVIVGDWDGETFARVVRWLTPG